ncbi:MAG: hypothetical protein FWB95_04445 [Treponema sp.]|nr:hypothetical protein [Treponema sp.]
MEYSLYRRLNEDGGIFRFTGGIESITDGRILWVKGDDLTIPVSLEKTNCYLLPVHEGSGLPHEPEQIKWNRISAITEGTKVFIGGRLKTTDNRLNFVTENDQPLMVIFYNCPDEQLHASIIRAARTRNEYWNNITPVSIVIGVMALIYIASSYLDRPAFRLTVITALVSVFIPILPIFPPGFLFTLLYRRFSWSARKLRADHDLIRFGFMPEFSLQLANKIALQAYTLEAVAWIVMVLGIAVNLIFIFLTLYLFRIISF